MKINYRILDVNLPESSITVRYFTDTITEDDLANEFEYINDIKTIKRTSEGHPTRCRTDYYLTVYNKEATEQDIINLIESSAPVDWFKIQETKDQPSTGLQDIKNNKIGTCLSFTKENPTSLSEEDVDGMIDDLT